MSHASRNEIIIIASFLHANEIPKCAKHEPATAKHYATADVQSARLCPEHVPSA